MIVFVAAWLAIHHEAILFNPLLAMLLLGRPSFRIIRAPYCATAISCGHHVVHYE